MPYGHQTHCQTTFLWWYLSFFHLTADHVPLLFQENHALLSLWARPRITTAEEHKPSLVKQLIVSLLLGSQLRMQFLQENAGRDINTIYFLEDPIYIDSTAQPGKTPNGLVLIEVSFRFSSKYELLLLFNNKIYNSSLIWKQSTHQENNFFKYQRSQK